jgi:hypothetical protein
MRPDLVGVDRNPEETRVPSRKIIVAGGVSFVVGALAFVLVFSYLAANFDYPGILEGNAAEVLPRLRAGGSSMRLFHCFWCPAPWGRVSPVRRAAAE